MTKKLVARYKGSCRKCHGHVPVGEVVNYDTVAKKIEHVACPEKPAVVVVEKRDPAPVYDRLEAVRAEKAATYAVQKAVLDEATASVKEAFLARGGCEDCQGTGIVLTWHTLDGDCYDEYGACRAEGCTPESREHSGLGYRGVRHTHPRRGAFPSPLAYSPWAEVAYAAVTAKIDALSAEEKALDEKLAVKRGSVVRVVRGRKVPKGTEGVVVWSGYGRAYSRWSGESVRLGIKDAEGAVHYTAASNVELVAYVEERTEVAA